MMMRWLGLLFQYVLSVSCIYGMDDYNNGNNSSPFEDDVVRINEMMQSNVDCIMDDINEFPDSWVELYNSSDNEIILNQYSIGISENAAESYSLPSHLIAPKSFALIYCDKVVQGLHTNFRIDSGKGEIFLFYEGKICDHQILKNSQLQISPMVGERKKVMNGVIS